MAWIFDLDGTLVHSRHDYAALKARLGLPPELAVLEGIATAPEADRPGLHRAVDAWERELADGSTAIDGAADVLARLHPLGILTRNTRETALRSLRAAGLVAPEVVVGRDEAPHKPAPDGVHRVLRLLGRPADGASMVGDGRFDLLAARAAGVRAVWFDPDRAGTHAHLADRVVHDLGSLLG